MPTKFEKAINNDGNKLTKVLEILMNDIVYSNIYNKLCFDIYESFALNKKIFNQSNTFWYLVLQSLKESRIIRLCRICDTQNNSISISNLLEAIKECNGLFSKDEFRKRLKDNPFVDSLADYNREINITELENEIANFNLNPTVKKIRKWRNNYIAHKGIKEGLVDFNILHENKLPYEEISIFINNCYSLIEKYLHTLNAVTWEKNIIGNDDFKNLIKFASSGLEKYEHDLDKEIGRCNKII